MNKTINLEQSVENMHEYLLNIYLHKYLKIVLLKTGISLSNWTCQIYSQMSQMICKFFYLFFLRETIKLKKRNMKKVH